jgi:3-oxoadipate enol-lactonase
VKTATTPRLFFMDAGAGEPVLLIPGFTISSAVFDPVAHLYVSQVRAVAYDHRGTGRSAAWPAPVSMAMLAADAARVLDDRGLRAAHVVGLSMGAGVALELAIRMPTRVKSLVLVGGGAGGPTTVLPPLTEALATIAEVMRDSVRRRRVWPAAALYSRAFRDGQPERVAELTAPFGAHPAPPWAIGWQALAASCLARAGSLARVRTPTLVLHGEQDVMSPPGNARRLAATIPGAELQLVPGAGHAVVLERAEDCAAVLLDWITRNADREPSPSTARARAGERLSRPWSLPAGAARNTSSLVTTVARRLGGATRRRPAGR